MKIGKALLLALTLSAVGTAAFADMHDGDNNRHGSYDRHGVYGGYTWHNHHYNHRYSCHHHWCYR